MGVLTLPAISTDYVLVPVAATIAANPTDPTSMPVQLAILPRGTTPTPTDWQTATWETDSTGRTYARLLVGPGTGGLALAPGRYTVWLRLTATPEIPVRAAGTLILT